MTSELEKLTNRMNTEIEYQSLNFIDTVDIICEFLQTAIHLILYVRELYPAELFEKQNKYNIPTPMSRHPELSGYIYDMILACKPDLEKGSIEKIHLIILKDENIPIERFVFQIDTLIDPQLNNNPCNLSKLNANDIESYLRSFLLKLSLCDSLLSPNPKGCTFALVMQLKEGAPHCKSGEFPWIPAEPFDPSEVPEVNDVDQVTGAPASKDERNLSDSFHHLIPLKDMNTGLVSIRMWVEESIYKGKLHAHARSSVHLDEEDSSSPAPVDEE